MQKHTENLAQLGESEEDKLASFSAKNRRTSRRIIERAVVKQERPSAVARMVYERGTSPSAPEIFAAAQAAKQSR